MKWDQNNQEKVKDFIAKMKQDYAFKKAYAARRAWEFYNHPDVAGMCYVAVGRLDKELNKREILAKKTCWAIDADPKKPGKVKIIDQEHAAELLEMAKDYLA